MIWSTNKLKATPRFGISPVFPESGKGERAAVFHGDRERELRFSRFAPFVEAVRWDQAAAFSESLPEGRCFIDGLSSGVDGPVRNLWVFCPIWNQSPLQSVERSLLRFRIEANGQHLLTRRDVVTDRQIRLLWDRNVVESSEFLFLSCSTIAAAHKL